MGSALDLIERFVLQAVFIYQIGLIIYILMSWVPASRETTFGRLLEKVTEPYLSIFRKFIPPLGMIDISPIVAIYALNLISRGIRNLFAIIGNSSLM